MGLKEYDVEENGVPHTVLLSDEDAEARGLKGGRKVAETKQADAPQDKSAKSRDK
jgi:hypothetical protein